jgi:hypothetical protein
LEVADQEMEITDAFTARLQWSIHTAAGAKDLDPNTFRTMKRPDDKPLIVDASPENWKKARAGFQDWTQQLNRRNSGG